MAGQQRVAVGGRLRDDVGRDRARSAGPVLDDDRLAEQLGHALAERSRHDVGAAARCETNEQPDRLLRPGLRARIRRES